MCMRFAVHNVIGVLVCLKLAVVQIIAGWVLGSAFALVYAVRACNLQQYVLLHSVRPSPSGLDNH